MTRRRWIWGAPALVYALFFLWYTDLRGPLDAEEITAFRETLLARGGDPERIALFSEFMRSDSGRHFLMLNALHFAGQPPDAGEARGESAEALMRRYMEHMLPELLWRACHPVVLGDAVSPAIDLSGIEGAERWSQGALVRYRSRRSFMEVVANPDTREQHVYKIAALEKTIAFPIETRIHLGDLRLLLGLGLLAGAGLVDASTRRG